MLFSAELFLCAVPEVGKNCRAQDSWNRRSASVYERSCTQHSTQVDIPTLNCCHDGEVRSCIPGGLVFVEADEERFILERHDVLEKCEYARLVIGRKDEDSHVEQGVFKAFAQARKGVTGSDVDEPFAKAPCQQDKQRRQGLS